MDWVWSGHLMHRSGEVVCGLGAAFFMFLWVKAWRTERRRTLVAKRWREYDAALSYVTEQPWDADARSACLDAGREYYRLAQPEAPADRFFRDAVPCHQEAIHADMEARMGRAPRCPAGSSDDPGGMNADDGRAERRVGGSAGLQPASSSILKRA